MKIYVLTIKYYEDFQIKGVFIDPAQFKEAYGKVEEALEGEDCGDILAFCAEDGKLYEYGPPEAWVTDGTISKFRED